jgi:hypothetical protein
MPRHLHWNELTGGITAAAVIVVATIAILLLARVGALHGKKATLYVVTDEASGVLAGTEVWLAGKKVGLVKGISFRPPSVDTMERLLITTEFLREALPRARRDSYASIRPGLTLIGTPVVYISPGTVAAPALHDGDTVHVRHKRMISNLAQDIGKIEPAFVALGAATKELNDKVSRPVGTLGNFRANGLPDLEDVSAGISSLNARATHGNGTIALQMRSNLGPRASRAMAAADSVRRLISSDKGSIGRFRRDSTLVTKASHVLAELDTLRALVTSPVGTIAAAHSDSVLARQLDRQHALLAALVKDIKSQPLRYIRF